MKLHSETVTSETARLHLVRFGSGPPLLLAHALAFSSRYFTSAAELLGARFECAALDLRGHGETQLPLEPEQFTIDRYADDLIAVLDRLGWDRAGLAGISLGAACSLRAALRYPDRVRFLLQDLPAFGPHSPRGIGKSSAVAEALERGEMEAAARAAGTGLSEPRARALGKILLEAWSPYDPRELGPKMAASFRASSLWTVAEPWPAELSRLSMPVTILGLAGDRSHPLEVAEQMAAAIPGARLATRVPSLDPRRVSEQWLELLETER